MASAVVQRGWLHKFVHGLNYTFGYINYYARVCEHKDNTCQCTNFNKVLTSYEAFTSSTQTFLCQTCTKEGRAIAYCGECKRFLDEHCVEYHKKIRSLLKHSIFFLSEEKIEQNFKCQNCIDGGKVVAFCRHCWFFLDEDCVRYHGKIKKLINHSIVDLRGKNVDDVKLSVLSPIKCCSNARHKDVLSLFCPDRGEMICAKCKDVKEFDNLTTVTSFYEIIDMVYDLTLSLNELLKQIQEAEPNLKGILSDLLAWIQLQPNTLDLASCLPAVQQILSSNLTTYHPGLDVPYAEVSCDLVKCTLLTIIKDLKDTTEIEAAGVDIEQTDCELVIVRRTEVECVENPDIGEGMVGAIGETLDTSGFNSLELFGEGFKYEADESGVTRSYLTPVNSEINELRKHNAFCAAGNDHDSFGDIHA